MRLSTGIILSILSANVFAIEHLNDAHSGSLLARRAVAADADGFSLQKRNDDKEPEEHAKPKKSVPNSDKEKFVYREDLSKDDPHSDPNPIDGIGECPTGFPEYDPSQDDEDKGRRKKAYAKIDSDQQRLIFSDAPGDSPSQTLGGIKKVLSRVKLGHELLSTKQRASAASNGVADHFGGGEGKEIGVALYKMLKYMAKTAWGYQELYNNPDTSPFYLELLPSTPDEPKQKYKWLQANVPKHIKEHISAINTAIEYIIAAPVYVIAWLEELMSSADSFYMSISDMRHEYSRLLAPLGMSGSGHLANLDYHMNFLGAYKCNLSERLDTIKGLLGNSIKPPSQEGSSKFSSPTLESMGLSEIGTKPSDDEASSSTQSNDVASSSTLSNDVASSNVQSNVAVVDNLVIF